MRAGLAARLACILAFALCLLLPARQSAAAEPEPEPERTALRPGYKLLRFQEDYAWLREFSGPREALDALKYIPFDRHGRVYLSLGGELRSRYEFFEAPGFGLELAREQFLLGRAQAHADLHLGRYVRAFAQLSSLGSLGPTDPSPLDRNALTVQQGFVELRAPLPGERTLMLRLGRQELVLGSGRLVAIRKGPNFRRSFDMARLDARLERATLSAFGGVTVRPAAGVFDDRSNLDDAMWGLYAITPLLATRTAKLNLDSYYLGVHRQGRALQDAQGLELRHSLGARLYGKLAGLDYNFEGLAQLGTLGDSSILAWTVASDTGYRFEDAEGIYAARIALRADVTSGDGQAGDGKVGTFDALHPNLKYFSESGLIVPSNLLDLHPVLALEAGPLALSLDHNFFWRQRRADAVYAPLTRVRIPGDASDARFMGQQLTAELELSCGPHLSLTGYYAHFFAGPVIRDAGGRDVDFFGTWAEYTF